MPDSDIEARMRRAISASVGEQWASFQKSFIREYVLKDLDTLPEDEKEREKIIEKIENWYADKRLLFIKDPAGESAFLEELFENPSLIKNRLFMLEWNQYRNIQMSRSLMEKNDPLTNVAMLEMPEGKEIPDEKTMIAHYFAYYENLGTERSGRLEEVIGPMGSGKSNYLAWKSIRALQRGYIVFTNFELKNVPQAYHSNWHKVNNLLDLLKETIELRQEGEEKIIFWILDEQGRVRGGSSITRSTKEARYLSELLTMIRKFGVFLTRARQVDNIPEDQRGWVSQIIRKNPNMPEVIHVEYLNDGETYEEYEFKIPSMHNYYDTNEPAEFDYNVDTETMQKFIVARANEGASPMEAIAEYLHISKKIAKKETKKIMKKLKKLAGPGRGENPNSLEALKRINEQRRMEKMKNTENQEGENSG